jgi:hypothetical protein
MSEYYKFIKDCSYIFENYNITELKWSQLNYFNVDNMELGIEIKIDSIDSKSIDELDREKSALLPNIYKIISSDLVSLFGNNVTITLKNDSIEIDEIY